MQSFIMPEFGKMVIDREHSTLSATILGVLLQEMAQVCIHWRSSLDLLERVMQQQGQGGQEWGEGRQWEGIDQVMMVCTGSYPPLSQPSCPFVSSVLYQQKS